MRIVSALFAVLFASLALSTSRASAGPFSFYSYPPSADGAWRTASGNTWLAQSFVSPNSASSLTSVAVKIRNANESNSGSTSSTYSVSIWSSISGSPGVNLATAVSNRSIGSWGEEFTTFTLGTALSLTSNTTYFIVVTGNSGGTTGWKCASSPSTDVSPIPTFTAFRSTDAGSLWSPVSGTCNGQGFIATASGTTPSIPVLSNFSPISARQGDAAITITPPTSSVQGTFTYSSSDPAVASVNGSTISFVTPGTAVITATFIPTDSTNYSSATVATTVTVLAPVGTSSPTTIASTSTSTSTPTTTSTTTTQPVAKTTTSTTSTTTTQPTSTTSSAPPTTITRPRDDNVLAISRPASPFSDNEGLQLRAQLQAEIGDVASGRSLVINATELTPAAPLTVTLYSTPTVLLSDRVLQNGTYTGTAQLPLTLESGDHTVVIESTSDNGVIKVAGAFSVDSSGRIVALAQPAVISSLMGPPDARLQRALQFGHPVYDPQARPLTTASLIIATTALIALAGAGGLGTRSLSSNSSRTSGLSGAGIDQSSNQPNRERRQDSRGKLANVVTKKLKPLNSDGERRGDASRTWQVPGTRLTDEISVKWPAPLGKWMSVGPRTFVDGAWLRAMFGSFGFATWLLGLIAGIVASTMGTSSAMVPIFGTIILIVVLGTFDAGAGAIAWLTMILISLTNGDLSSWADLRTALGLGVLMTSISLLAHVIRPLRRSVTSSFDRTERILDYIIMPVFVAFAAGSMLKALNGLSGLEIVSRGDVSTTRWIVGISILLRLAVEDIASQFYPARMMAVQPPKFTSPNKVLTGLSILVRSLVFLMIAEPFFGVTNTTILAALLLAVPKVVKIWEDDLPNSIQLNKWLPRGHAQFFVLLVVGMWLTSVLLGSSPTSDDIKSSFIWLLLPGVVAGLTELFGRHGGVWPNVAIKRFIGTCTWMTAVSLTTGWFTPFS